MASSGLLQLIIGLDGLKICTLDVQDRQKSFRQQFMWERKVPLSSTVTLKPGAYYQESSWLSKKFNVDGFSGWHLMRYLPLVKDGNLLYGLSVYRAAGGITGLEAHFRFHTSKNRIARFQPLIELKPELLQTGKISGLYYDALRVSSQRLQTIGVMEDPNQPVYNTDQAVIPEDSPNQYSTNLTASVSGTFGSSVVVKDITTIQACYIRERCTGLAFTLAKGRVEILGQWFECTGQHSLLFNSTSDRDPKGLRFHLQGASHIAVVNNVTILYAEGDNGSVEGLDNDSAEGAVKDAKCSLTKYTFGR
ncbi:uncharacterized protein EI97DRAFT_446787 [Westerdykella ornata]|uniref:Uncharacterized protein n=1 Tax=Westerdykella ornata TaxID=318751 RepID=A0A6A6J3T6_WESOR|nr:uncharacterized protein EI97DRAFT_446787 [Westerdykella ornata]KAF2271231.1 hypothetical protein EI97DRAFT_446787 [Westerdykella ornata]